MNDLAAPFTSVGAAVDFDAIVLGAGISGLVSASILASEPGRRVLVVDEYGHIGGNHIDRTIGDYTFDVGSFIFQDDSPLLAHFPELLSRYLPIEPTWCRLTPAGVVTAYPISVRDDILAQGPGGIVRILSSALYARVFHRDITNAREFARFWIGEDLLRRSGLESYLTRFYGVAPDRIDVELARKRMRWISENASIRAMMRRVLSSRQARAPTNRQLARPRQGFAHLYDAVRETLEARGVTFLLGAKLQTLANRAGTFVLGANGDRLLSSRVISTIPLPRVQALCGVAPERLETSTLLSLFFSFSGRRGFDPSIIYNFSHQGEWKRITVYSDFYGRANGREYFTAEVVGRDPARPVAAAEASFRAHVAANRLFEGDLRLEGSFALENAYPIYTERASERAADAILALRRLGVESFGRQGGFNYQPTARVSTIEAEAALGGTGAPAAPRSAS